MHKPWAGGIASQPYFISFGKEEFYAMGIGAVSRAGIIEGNG
jgi:hypothetical protein